MSDKHNNSIGGFFSLELPIQHQEYYPGAVAVNSGKNAFEYILASYGFKVKKVYLPYFTSRIMIKPLQEHNIPHEYYHINENLEIASNIELHEGELLVYTNYFGLKGEYVKKIAPIYGQSLIIDNAQAFFEKPLSNVNTFYSPRKFFGVLDGGYVYTQGTNKPLLTESISYDRMSYLLKRIDTSAEEAYPDYKSSCHLGGFPVQKMSKLTHRILGSLDYEAIAYARRKNFSKLSEKLASSNKLHIDLGNSVPLVYPYLTDDDKLRSHLIANKVYVAQYWPNVLDWCENDDLEYYLATHIIPLPIDQRYDEEDMKRILDILAHYK